MSDLLKKYNRPGPRYTSYPPVPFWGKVPTKAEWIGHIQSTYNNATGMDIYIHVPFCERLCYYCGCNRQITKNHKVEDTYVKLIIKEWKMYIELLGFIPKVNSLHFGGGTPTFLSASNLKEIIDEITVNKSETFIGSIEIDPRAVTTDHLDMLVSSGFTRFSLGIQDFDPVVQKAINRIQSFELVENVVFELRKRKIESLNFDVIYGLPKQTCESITETFNSIDKLSPDQIAFFSYAHLPERLVNQRLIKSEDLPDDVLKVKLYETGKAILKENGLHDVGMDHFARENNFLYKAKEDSRLHRNFMGYVDKKSSVLLGLGPSSISDSSVSFMQNAKNFGDYETAINKSQLPISSGHVHNADELLVQKTIIDLMCTDKAQIQSSLPYHEQVMSELAEFEADGLLKISDQTVSILPAGKKFIRNVAMTFDFHLREKLKIGKFSQVI